MESFTATKWKLEQWVVKPQSLELIHLQTKKKLEPKAMELLCYLIKHQGEVVSAKNLLEELWQGVSVSENSVRRLITQLRKALEDEVNAPRFIETIPKRGYKLVCTAKPLETQQKKTKRLTQLKLSTLIILSALLGSIVYLLIFNGSEPILLDASKYEISRITSTPGEESLPAITGNLSRVHYIHTPQISKKTKLRVRELDSGKDSLIHGFVKHPYSVSWSYDGNKVAFVDVESCQIFIAEYNHDSKSVFNTESISHCKSPYLNRLQWLDNGNLLYLTQYDELKAKREHFQYDISSKKMSKLDIGHEKYDWRLLRLYPHSTGKQWLVKTRDNSETLSLWLYTPKTSERRLLVKNAKSNIESSWCSNSTSSFVYSIKNKLYIFSNGEMESYGEFPVPNFVSLNCREDSSGKKKIVFSPISPNSSLIAQQNPLNYEATSFPKLIYPSTQIDTNPRHSRTSGKLAFVSKRNDKWQVWQGEGESTSLLSKHAFKKPPYIIGWSPEEKKLLLLVERKPMLLYLATGEIEEIGIEDKHVSFSHWGRHENELLFTITEENRVYSYNIETKKLNPINQSESADIGMSPDNRTLFFTSPVQKGLWSLDLELNLKKLVFSDFPLHSVFHITTKGVYFYQHKTKATGLYFFDFSTKKVVPVITNSSYQSHNFSISFDLSELVFVYKESLEADLRLIEITK